MCSLSQPYRFCPSYRGCTGCRYFLRKIAGNLLKRCLTPLQPFLFSFRPLGRKKTIKGLSRASKVALSTLQVLYRLSLFFQNSSQPFYMLPIVACKPYRNCPSYRGATGCRYFLRKIKALRLIFKRVSGMKKSIFHSRTSEEYMLCIYNSCVRTL